MARLTDAEASRRRQQLLADKDLDMVQTVPQGWSQLRNGTQRDAKAEQEARDMMAAELATVLPARNREPKSIHAEVRSFSIPRPRPKGAKPTDGYEASKVRHGPWNPSVPGKRGWITIART